MGKLLARIFIKDYKNVDNPIVRNKYGVVASLFGIISNIIISILKIIIGLLFNMVSFLADGINNLSDAFSSIISLIGFKISSKPADKDHPFGHARMEYISSFIIALFISFVGFELITQSIQKIIANDPINKDISFIIISTILLLISIIVKFTQLFIYYSYGKKIKSETLKITSLDSRNDIIATSTILIGLIISYFTNVNLDGYLGTAVGLFIIISGIKSVIETINELLGQKPDKETIQNLITKIKSYKGVLGIHDLQIHTYGGKNIFASCHVEIDASKNILETHEMIDTIENSILNELNIHIVLHMDPIVLHDPETAKYKKLIEKILNSFALNLKFHDFRIIKGPTFTNIIFDLVLPEKLPISQVDLINEITKKVKEVNNNYNLVMRIDYDYEDLSEDI